MRKQNNPGANKSKQCKGKQNADKKQQPRKDSNSKRVNYDNTRENKFERDINEGKAKPNANDVAWYSRNPALLTAAGSVPISNILGFPNRINPTYATTTTAGILSLPWSPSVGSIETINQCFNSMYSYVVHANSRNYSYNAPDLGMLVLAGTNVFGIISTMIRAYGTMKYYQERNMYAPKAMVAAMGFIYDDLINNLSRMWFDINNLIDMTKQIWIPNTMPLLDRWMKMNSTLYTDSQDTVSQTYMYVQDTYYVYSETASKKGGCLLPVGFQGQPVNDHLFYKSRFNPGFHQYDWSYWVGVARGMIQALIESEDRGIIFGDLLNAYGPDKIVAMSPIDSNLTIVPEYNAEVLVQIENYVSTEAYTDGVMQDPDDHNNIKPIWGTNPLVPANPGTTPLPTVVRANIERCILNFHISSQPDPGLVAVATRMIALGYQTFNGPRIGDSGDVTTVLQLRPRTVGTEVPHDPIYWYFQEDDGSIAILNSNPMRQLASVNSEDYTMLPALCKMMAFDWHPFFYLSSSSATIPTTAGNVSPTPTAHEAGDFANYGVVDWQIIDKLHRVCEYSLLGVPHF